MYAGQEAEPEVRTRHGTMDWFQIGKEVHQGCIKKYIKAVYCHSAYLTYMQSTSCKMLGWVKHKLESRWPADDTTLMEESEEELKSLLMNVKEESEKAGLKLSTQKK